MFLHFHFYYLIFLWGPFCSSGQLIFISSFSIFDFIFVCCRYLQSSTYQVFTLPPCSICSSSSLDNDWKWDKNRRKNGLANFSDLRKWKSDSSSLSTNDFTFIRTFYLFSYIFFIASKCATFFHWSKRWNSIFDRISQHDDFASNLMEFLVRVHALIDVQGFLLLYVKNVSYVCSPFETSAAIRRIQHDLHIFLNENRNKNIWNFIFLFFFSYLFCLLINLSSTVCGPCHRVSHNFFFSLSLWFSFLLLFLFTFCTQLQHIHIFYFFVVHVSMTYFDWHHLHQTK